MGVVSQKLKLMSRKILSRIDSGEKAVTTVVHVLEIVNILEKFIARQNIVDMISDLLSHNSIGVLAVTNWHYLAACEIAKEHDTGINDALAYLMMQSLNLKEIYSFDRHFDKIEGIKRIEN